MASGRPHPIMKSSFPYKTLNGNPLSRELNILYFARKCFKLIGNKKLAPTGLWPLKCFYSVLG